MNRLALASLSLALGSCLLPFDVTINPDAGVALDGARICHADDDCVATDFCTNARKCMAGSCRTVGGVPDCNDNVACTSDRCEPALGTCVHHPVDAMCGAGMFCDTAARTCSSAPSCTSDSACGSLPTDACLGPAHCAGGSCVRGPAMECADTDACTTDVCTVGSNGAANCQHIRPVSLDVTTDPNNCGTCGNVCPGGTNQLGVCAASLCSKRCAMGFFDTNNNPADGCECQPTGVDLPDLTFTDTDCDGIDGAEMLAIFVAPDGDDAAAGTRLNPKRTLQAALDAAVMARPVRSVFMSAGTYTGPATLRAGVSVYGGYDRAHNWARARTNVTTIRGGDPVLTANGATLPIEIQLLDIEGVDLAGNSGNTVYGIELINMSTTVTVTACTVHVGSGGDGAPGASGGAGMAGGNGGPGFAAQQGGTGGIAGAGMCNAGGLGGGGAVGTAASQQGGSGGGQMAGTAAGAGGAGSVTNANMCVASVGNPGIAGADGGNGSPGAAAQMVGTFTSMGYQPADGGNGTGGVPGGGGGGGGGGAGAFCSGARYGGGGGGGGGAGGCGGEPGHGGGGGGGAFAIAAFNTQHLIVNGSDLQVGNGGHGGAGGNGNTGGARGTGGSGGDNTVVSGTREGGVGGLGAPGGNGGISGGGAGGSGGPAICVAYGGTGDAVVTDSPCVHGTAGAGGAGGTSPGGVPAGAAGMTSVAADTRALR